VRIGVLADQSVVGESDVIGGGCKPDLAAARVDQQRSGQERKAPHSEQDREAEENSETPYEEGSAFSNTPAAVNAFSTSETGSTAPPR
jgi:hypothetical protein